MNIDVRVLLFWPHDVRAKNYNEEHTQAPPSMERMFLYVKVGEKRIIYITVQ